MVFPFCVKSRRLIPIAVTILSLVSGIRFCLAQEAASTTALAATAPGLSTAGKKSSWLPVLDPNKTPFPQSSLQDFSYLLDAPAGKHGFLTAHGDHFTWKDGRRARFWGINVANSSLQESDANIDAMIEAFRTAGFNLVRLHHFDERDGIINSEAPSSRYFVAERLRKLDYWIYKAKQAGLYVFLDLLDYRRFKEGDGVPNAAAIGRAARPYAVFDPRLIELQKEYARALMRDHVNPYTGLAYADDPAVVMLELYDESGLFMRRTVWREMPEPYAAQFKKLWNEWLKDKYKTTDELAASWTDGAGKCALDRTERLEDGSVEVPAMTWTPEQLPPGQQRWAAAPRRNDGARFAYEVHRKYFREMREYLRGIGVRIPISTTGRFDDMPDLKSVSEELDFIGCNFYYDHPYWSSTLPAWQPPSFFHNHNPMSHIDELSMAASVSLARVRGKPFVVREWNYCWPNRNRAAGMIEAAAYASLHDIDAMILFGYETMPTPRVSYFNVRSDPSRWGLSGVGAAIFLRGLIQPSQHKIIIPYGPIDTFTYQLYHQPLYALGWTTRVENDFYDGSTYQAPPGAEMDLLVSPGRSGLSRYTGAPSLLYANDFRGDLAGRPLPAPDYLTSYNMFGRPAGTLSLKYDGLLMDNGASQQRNLTYGLPLNNIIGSGLRPIGISEANNVAAGFLDMKQKRMVFGQMEGGDVLRAALDALQVFYNVPNSHDATEQSVFTSDTGEMLRDAASGRLVVSAPQFQALCGNLNGVGRVLAPGLRVRNMKSGTLIALALDGKPLVESRRFMIKMVSDARNVDEKSGPDPRFSNAASAQWRVDVLGAGPVTTQGQAVTVPIQIGIERRPLLDVYLDRGSFELLVDGDDWKFYCDTPDAKFVLYRPNGTAMPGVATAAAKPPPPPPSPMQQVTAQGDVRPLATTADGAGAVANYPAEAVLVRSVG